MMKSIIGWATMRSRNFCAVAVSGCLCIRPRNRLHGAISSIARVSLSKLSSGSQPMPTMRVAMTVSPEHVPRRLVVQKSGAKSVVDLGCGEGKLLRELMALRQLERIVGMDVSVRSLEFAHERLRLEQLGPTARERIQLIHGSLMYRDRRLQGFEMATVIEVVEHLDAARLQAFERVLFGEARPKSVVLTTPNAEYNVKFETLPAGQFRHPDHRFEWTRAQFEGWAQGIAERFGYVVRFDGIGENDAALGAPTQ